MGVEEQKKKKEVWERKQTERAFRNIHSLPIFSFILSYFNSISLSLSLLFLFQIRVFANSIQSNSLSQIPCLIQSPPLLPLLLSPETSARKRGYISQFRIHSVWFSRKLSQTKQNCDIFLFRFISFENLFYF